MKPTHPKLSAVDFRLLHSGWSFSDAILITASELRNEPEARIRVLFDDLIEHRIQQKKSPQPYLVILTRTGNLPADHPVFHPDPHPLHHTTTPILIATTTEGAKNLPAELQRVPNVPEVVIFDGAQGVDYAALFQHLYQHRQVRFIDCATGGDVIHQLVMERFINEIRFTMSGQLAGAMNSQGVLRPHFFPTRKHLLFTAQNAPHLEWTDLRMAGKQLIFVRTSVQYRH